MKNYLAVIDMQNDFIDGALGTKEAEAIVGAVAAKIAEAKKTGTFVIFTRDTHYENYFETLEGKKLPVKHCIKESKGWEISPLLDTDGAVIIDKPTFGSFELADAIDEDADRIELVGLCTDICVISNALLLRAKFPNKLVTVDAACCAGVTPASHENALNAMKLCQIDIINETK